MSLSSKKAEAKIRAGKLGGKIKARNREINRKRESRGLVLLLTKITYKKSSLVNIYLPFKINSKELERVNLLRASKKIRSIILGDYLTILVATTPPKLKFKLVSASSSRLDYILKTLVYTIDEV